MLPGSPGKKIKSCHADLGLSTGTLEKSAGAGKVLLTLATCDGGAGGAGGVGGLGGAGGIGGAGGRTGAVVGTEVGLWTVPRTRESAGIG